MTVLKGFDQLAVEMKPVFDRETKVRRVFRDGISGRFNTLEELKSAASDVWDSPHVKVLADLHALRF